VFALLDLIGWAPDRESGEVQVDLPKYGRRLTEAVGGYLPLLADQEAEADANDLWRAEQGKPARKSEIIASALALHEFATLIEQAVKESAG
jgi:hypothetical protein